MNLKPILTFASAILLAGNMAFAQGLYPGEPANGGVLAFPTAEGFGKYATGGRGGKVVTVTNLNSDGEGSLRWAFDQHKGEPITIVFAVSGNIVLESEMRINRANWTLAGQTAPGEGIQITHNMVNFGGSKNFIVRNVRFRTGAKNTAGEVLQDQALGAENCENFIFDHCDFGWSVEENINTQDSHFLTVQYSIVHEGLYNAGHKKGARGYGSQFGGSPATYHHNLLAHNNSRSPRLNGARGEDYVVFMEYINNVNFNYGGQGGAYGGENTADLGNVEYNGLNSANDCNFMNNYYVPGPMSSKNNVQFMNLSYARAGATSHAPAQFHISGNVCKGLDQYTADNWYGSGVGVEHYTKEQCKVAERITPTRNWWRYSALTGPKGQYTPAMYMLQNLETAEQALATVKAKAGCIVRDAVERRIVEEVETGVTKYGTNGRIDKESDCEGFAAYPAATAPVDTDGDGMPDEWEQANGFNPNVADNNTILASGRTALEAYLNSLMGEVESTAAPAEYKPYDIVVAKDGSGDYTTIQAAVDAAPDNGQRTVIYVKNGEYNEKVLIGNRYTDSKKVLSIIGESREGVIISWDDYRNKQIQYPDRNGNLTTISAGGMECATFTVTSPDFYMENVTVRNTCDETKGQAEAFYQAGDRQVLKNVSIEGWQDTYRSKKGRRHFIYNSTIKGNTDFIYSGGTSYFYQCDIVSRPYSGRGAQGGYITAPEDVTYKATLSDGNPIYYEFFFNDCDLKAEDPSHTGVSLGRNWSEKDCGAFFMNCRMGSHIADAGWATMSGTPVRKTSSFGEYKSVKADGTTPVDVSKRAAWSFQLQDRDLALVDLDAIYGKVSSTPFPVEEMAAGVKSPTNKQKQGEFLTWDVVPGAAGYAVFYTKNGKELVAYTNVNKYNIGAKADTYYAVEAISKYGSMSTAANTVTAEELHDALNPAAANPAENVTVTATPLPAEGGSVEPATATVKPGTEVTFVATASAGYEFVHWEDEQGNTLTSEAEYKVAPQTDVNIFARFKETVVIDEDYHAPVATAGYAFEFTDLTEVPTQEFDVWIIKPEYATWMTHNDMPMNVSGRQVNLDPYTGQTVAYHVFGTNNMIRVGTNRELTMRVKNTSKFRIYYNGAASTPGHLIADVTPEGGQTVTHNATVENGKGQEPQSWYLEFELDQTKKYSILLHGTQDMALWALNLTPGSAGIDDIVIDLNGNAPIYNLQGIMVKNLVPGQIYIQNGAKFIAR